MRTLPSPSVLRLNRLNKLGVFAVSAVLLVVHSAHAAGGSWNVDAAGNWNTGGNWNPAAVPGTAAGDIVNLTNNISAARTVTIDTAVTLGGLNIGDSDTTHAFTLALGSGSLTFNNSGSGASITQVGTSKGDTISAAYSLLDNLTVTNNSANILTLSGVGTVNKSNATLTQAGTGVVNYGGLVFNSSSGTTFTTSGTSTANSSGFGAITFNAGTSAMILSGTSIGIGNTGAGSVTNNSGVLQTFSNTGGVGLDMPSSFVATVNAGTGGISFATGLLNKSGNSVLATTGTGAITVSSLDISAVNATNFTINGSASTINVGAISASVNTAANLIYNGSGTLNLTGNNTYNGTTTLNSGTTVMSGNNTGTGATIINNGNASLILDFSTAATPTNIIKSGNALTLGGGNLTLKGAATGASSQTLGTVTLTANTGSGITLNSNGGGGTTLALGATPFTRNAGSTVNIDLSSGNATVTTALAAQTLGYATVKDSTGTSFARATGTGIVGLTGATTLASGSNASGTDFITSPTGSSTSGSPYLTMTGSFSANTLTLDSTGAAGANTLDLGGGTMTLTQKGILSTGSNGFTIQNGQVGAANTELIVHTMGTGGLTIGGTVGSGTTSLTKDGTDTLIISGANTYSGATAVNSGALQAGSASALSANSAFTLANTPGAILNITGFDSSIGSLAGGGTAGGNVVLGSNTLTVGGNNTTTTYSGVISGTNGVLVKTGTGTLTLSSANTFTGGLIVKAGAVTSGAVGSFGTSTITIGDVTAGQNAQINLLANNTLSNAISIASGAGTRTIGYSGGVVTVSSAITLASGSTLTISSSSNNATGATFTGGVTGPGSLIISTTAAGSTAPIIFSTGSLNNGGTITNSGSGVNTTTINSVIGTSVTGLTQNNSAGILKLAGANTFSGPTLVSAGTLQLANVNALQNSPLDVSGAGTVSFTVAGTNTYNLGGLKGTGSLNAGTNSLTLGASAISTVTIAGSSSFQASPAINVTAAAFTFNGTLNINISTSLTAGSNTFNLFDGNTAGTFTAVSIAGTYTATLNSGNSYHFVDGSGNDFSFNNTNGNLTVIASAIPEPATYAAIFGMLALAGTYWRRRRVAG